VGRAKRPHRLSIACLLVALSSSAAERPAIGDPVPLPIMRDLRDGGDRSLTALAGRAGIVVLFWAGWSQRSIEELQRLDAAAQEMAAHGMAIAAVNVDRQTLDDAETTELRNRVDRLGVRIPVLVDRGLKLFHDYGVVTIPSTALVDGNGRLAYFLFGYSNEQREELFDAMARLAGITRPQPPQPLTVAPAALRRLQLGRLQLAQGHEAPARSSFETAIKADETFADPIVELAALALDSSDANGARALLDRAAAVEAGHLGVERERARLLAVESHVDRAQAALEQLTASHADAIGSAYLGYLLQAAGNSTGASLAFEKARTLSGLDPRGHISDSIAAALRAMAVYRREVAVAKR
jgi:thioredoxin-like negative regulator of GroEL